MKRIQGNDHSHRHSARVCLLVTMIAQRLKIDPNDILRLQIAAILHDKGRHNNINDAKHGEKTVVWAISEGYNLDSIICDIIRYHCKGDRTASHLDAATLRLLWVFKDADALDRVRTDDLDQSKLRYQESRELIHFAKSLLKEYET